MPLPAWLRFLRAAPADGVTDAGLLRRYAATRDQAAFELLVRRHADLVWGVCRGVLRREADAEDAFQATFLALARKAGSVRGASAAGWLHRVARHAALKLRARAVRDAPAGLPDLPAPAGPDPDLAAAVHEELARLGERYRLPVLLCDLEGHTHAEAARALGWPVGTVSGRLSRGRARLRARLERRGVAVAALAGLAAAPGGASGHLIRSAASAAGGGASAAVVSLTEGVLSAMRTAKLKLLAAASAAAVGLAGMGGLVAVGQGRKPADPAKPDDRPAVSPAGVKKPDPAWNQDDGVPSAFPDLKSADLSRLADSCPLLTGSPVPIYDLDAIELKLLKAKLNTQRAQLRLAAAAWARGQAPAADLFGIAHEAVKTARLVYEPGGQAVPWLREGVALAKAQEAVAEAVYKAASGNRQDLLRARVARLDAELELARRAK